MPYAPTVQDRTGEFLMRGITGAADAVAQGIQTYRKNKEEHGGLVSLVENKVKTIPGLVDKYGDKLAKAPAMSLSQLKALNSSLDLEIQNDRLAKEQQFKQEDLNLRKAYFDLQQGQLARSTERDAAGRRFMESLAELGQDAGRPSMDFANTLAGEPGTGEISLVKMFQAGRKSGIGPEQLAELAPIIRAEQMGQRHGLAVDPTPVPFSAGGLSGVFSPKTGQFQVDKPEPNPKDARMTVVLERDDMDRPTRTWTGSPKQYEEQFGKALPGAPAAATAPDEDALVQEALAKATTDEQRATIRALYKQRTGRVLK